MRKGTLLFAVVLGGAALGSIAVIVAVNTAQGKKLPSFRRGSLDGACWLSRENGRSDIQRGVKLYLLPDGLPAEKVVPVLQSRLSSLHESIKMWKDGAARLETGPLPLAEEGKRYRDSAKAEEQNAAGVEKAIAECQGTHELIDTSSALRSAGSHAIALARAAYAHEATTDVDGKYRFDSVPAGDYVLCAEVRAGGKATWTVPVKVSGATKLDLYNDNAKITD